MQQVDTPPVTSEGSGTHSAEKSGAPASHPDPAQRKKRKRRRLAAILGLLISALAAIGYWALDEYVIDHVEIDDVAAYSSGRTGEDGVALAGESSDEEASEGDVEAEPAILTDTTYSDGEVSIEIATVVTGSGSDTVTYYVAEVMLSDATDLRAGFANNQFGTNIVEDTSVIAESYDAIFAINGDYYGFRETGIVIRNGVVYRDEPARIGLAIYADGTMEVYDETATTADDLLDDGVWNTLSFGPGLVDDGEIVDGIDQVEIDTNFGNHSIQGEQPRTGIGVIDDNHFVFVVVDGRSRGYSDGVTMTEFAEIFLELGATEAYNLDGGGSATMYFNGELVNNPLGRGQERGTSDILYVAGEPEVVS